jgi:Holliday junction resolvase RusA-like endonuclease
MTPAQEIDLFRFVVRGEPKGQPRPRAFARRIVGDKFMARVYDAGTAEGWKSQIAIVAREQGLYDKQLSGPLFLSMVCFFQRPKSHFGTGKNLDIVKKVKECEYHVNKPDLDNIVKAAQDALKLLGAYSDDSQLAKIHCEKRWSLLPSYTEFLLRRV